MGSRATRASHKKLVIDAENKDGRDHAQFMYSSEEPFLLR